MICIAGLEITIEMHAMLCCPANRWSLSGGTMRIGPSSALDDFAQFAIHAIEKVCYVLTANASKTILAT